MVSIRYFWDVDEFRSVKSIPRGSFTSNSGAARAENITTYSRFFNTLQSNTATRATERHQDTAESRRLHVPSFKKCPFGKPQKCEKVQMYTESRKPEYVIA